MYHYRNLLMARLMKGLTPFGKPKETDYYAETEDKDFQGLPPTTKTPEERANEVISKLTWDEKVELIGGYKWFAIKAIPKLGMPSIWTADATAGLHQYRGGVAFPSPVAMTASWDRENLKIVAKHVGEQCRARGISILLGPGVNIYRVPTCGRNFEYMGEDPFLAGQMSSAYVEGVQSQSMIATVKHFACNNSDYERHKTDAIVDERTLHEIYLPAFETAVKEGKTWSIMSSYNLVNGTWASENKHLLTEILRDKWGFEGFVMSDWISTYSTDKTLLNGLDLEMPSAEWWKANKVNAAVESGKVKKEDIDKILYRLFKALFAAGVYDRPSVDPNARLNCDEYIETSKKVGEECIVLLKNENNILPLSQEKTKKIVVVGPSAINTETGGGGAAYVKAISKQDIYTGIKTRFPNSIVEVIPYPIWFKERLKKGFSVLPNKKQMKKIKNADAVIACMGFDSIIESECWDRRWELGKEQEKLINTCAAANKNTIVVATVGGGFKTEGWVHNVKALVHSFYLGERVGDAVANVICGNVNPSGKLPFTMAKEWLDFEANKNYVKKPEHFKRAHANTGMGDPNFSKIRPMKYEEGLMIGYRHFDTNKIEPQFPFGHGLSYTSFKIGNISADKDSYSIGENVKISVDVSNTGEVKGKEVVQIYVKPHGSLLPRPEKELKEFAKVELLPGETKTVSFELPPRAFSYYNPDSGEWVVDREAYTIVASNSSRPENTGTCETTIYFS